MRIAVALALASTVAAAACGPVQIKKAEPKLPEGVDRQAEAYDRAKDMEALCRSRGTVSRRDGDTDGSRATDYECERRKPTRK